MKRDAIRVGAIDALVLASACTSACFLLEPAVAVIVDQLAVPGHAFLVHVVFWAEALSTFPLRAEGVSAFIAVGGPLSPSPTLRA